MAATASMWLRTTLMGQVPRPSDSAAQTKLARWMAASAAALSTASRWSLAKGTPARSATRRMRRLSAQNSRNRPQSWIQGMVGISSAMAPRRTGSSTTITLHCWRSDFDGAEKAAANTTSSRASSTGSPV